SELDRVDRECRSILTDETIRAIVSLIPDDWLAGEDGTPEERRNIYVKFLTLRLAASAAFIKEAQHARESLI
ncbi:MAG: aminotransferase class, partial [Sediminibacterium sp.]|nr:aminotransferase class [Sediminibacterium sp.]